MKFNIIYADPPWNYTDKRDKHKRLCGGASIHYNTMKLEDIKSLPVNEIADTNCMLFLWCTFLNLREGLEVIKAWGFKYKTIGFVWIKTNKKRINYKNLEFDKTYCGNLKEGFSSPFFGIGFYTKSNAEICLIGVKGKPIKINNSISSIVISPKEEHSKKPDIVRNKIIQLCGDIPRIELFARQKSEGWVVLGDEIDHQNIQETLKLLI